MATDTNTQLKQFAIFHLCKKTVSVSCFLWSTCSYCHLAQFAGWSEKFPDNPLFAQSPLLNQMVAEGKLGNKVGEGFYKTKK